MTAIRAQPASPALPVCASSRSPRDRRPDVGSSVACRRDPCLRSWTILAVPAALSSRGREVSPSSRWYIAARAARSRWHRTMHIATPAPHGRMPRVRWSAVRRGSGGVRERTPPRCRLVYSSRMDSPHDDVPGRSPIGAAVPAPRRRRADLVHAVRGRAPHRYLGVGRGISSAQVLVDRPRREVYHRSITSPVSAVPRPPGAGPSRTSWSAVASRLRPLDRVAGAGRRGHPRRAHRVESLPGSDLDRGGPITCRTARAADDRRSRATHSLEPGVRVPALACSTGSTATARDELRALREMIDPQATRRAPATSSVVLRRSPSCDRLAPCSAVAAPGVPSSPAAGRARGMARATRNSAHTGSAGPRGLPQRRLVAGGADDTNGSRSRAATSCS